MKPTKAQSKEFWEGRGWVRNPNGWSEPNSAFIWRELPAIDLNNLFKYAVPKVVSIDLQTWCSEPHATLATVYSHGNNPISVWDKDPALALFWALWEVREKSNEQG